MKLHTALTQAEVRRALGDVQRAGHVTPDIGFMQLDSERSMSRPHGFKIQLGTYDKTSGPTRSRHYKNSGSNGAGDVWAATYDEWGWFIERVFELDPSAIFGPYKSMSELYARWTPLAAERRAADAAARREREARAAARKRVRAAQAELPKWEPCG